LKNVLLFGASGHLGKEIAKELKRQNYSFTVVVRNRLQAEELSLLTHRFKVTEVTIPALLRDICQGYDTVISALGKSVSLEDKSKATFRGVDYTVNENILDSAIKNGVRKFIYVSAFQAERFQHLEYFKAHHEFSEKLIKSGINFSIIKPPALFSAFLDLIKMAKNGRLVNIGHGNRTTNPISEADLAVICVNQITENNQIVEAGGKNIYTRKQINEIILRGSGVKTKLKTIPLWSIKLLLPLIKLVSKNTHDKISFFVEVIQHDLVAPKMGKINLEEYIREKIK
jgi:uncharacterized protein YbjT (DUF2867 family)